MDNGRSGFGREEVGGDVPMSVLCDLAAVHHQALELLPLALARGTSPGSLFW